MADTITGTSNSLDHDDIARLSAATDTPAVRVAHNAVSRVGANEAALDRHKVRSLDGTFSVLLDDWKVTNQRASGRCWMFAGLNLLRADAVTRFKRKDFEFSQSYLQFWDKLERVNYFLQAVEDTAHLPIDDRRVAFIIDHALDDGGQWNMFAALVAKHGLVPQQAMPETFSSSRTRRLNAILLSVFRRGARLLREHVADGAAPDAVAGVRQQVLTDVYRVLRIDLGEPPSSFLWQWNDDERTFHREGEMTPLQFAHEYLQVPTDQYICLVHDPRADNPPELTYTVELLGNVVEAPPVKYLNVERETLKDHARRTLEDGEPVWFGCDSGKHMLRKEGLWDAELYDFQSLYGVGLDLDKEQRLHYHESVMTHAMLLTGVDLVDGAPRRWRCENSWGDEVGSSGFFTLSDAWFDEYVLEIAAHRERVPAALLQAYKQEPQVLPPWDPMGSLA